MSLYGEAAIDSREGFTCQFPPNSCPGGCGAGDPEDCQCCPDCGDWACSCIPNPLAESEALSDAESRLSRERGAGEKLDDCGHDDCPF